MSLSGIRQLFKFTPTNGNSIYYILYVIFILIIYVTFNPSKVPFINKKSMLTKKFLYSKEKLSKCIHVYRFKIFICSLLFILIFLTFTFCVQHRLIIISILFLLIMVCCIYWMFHLLEYPHFNERDLLPVYEKNGNFYVITKIIGNKAIVITLSKKELVKVHNEPYINNISDGDERSIKDISLIMKNDIFYAKNKIYFNSVANKFVKYIKEYIKHKF